MHLNAQVASHLSLSAQAGACIWYNIDYIIKYN